MDVMTEPRRLNFTTVGPMGKEKKKKSSLIPTIRFTLALRESNDKKCPEFSYADLMKNALGDCKNAELGDFELEDQNENERLVALARSFEERYGPKHSKTQSKRCDAIQDLIDLGDGYDETDPFVDNSEAYDELVPACLTTKLGGFYINSGVLDFRDVSDDSSNEFVSSPIKKKKKRVVITSDPESDGEMKKKIPKIKKLKDGMNKERRKKSLWDKEFKKPRKPTNKDLIRKKTPSTVKELLKQQPVSVPNSPTYTTPISSPVTPTIPHTIPTTTTPTTTTPPVTTSNNITNTNTTLVSTSNNEPESDPNVNNYSITTPNIGLLSQDKSSSSSSGYMVTTPTITSSGVQENDAVKVESGLNISLPFNNVKEDSNSQEPDNKPSDPESIPKLVDGIPDPLEKTINQLKQAAEDSVEGKCKFFTTEVNKMLLEIETESRLLNSSQRSSIYNHLAAFLPCSKETLLKRAKKLILTHQDDKLKEPTQRLRDAINEEMPAQLEKFKNEYHGTSLENPYPTTDHSDVKEEGSTESDEEKSTENEKNDKKCLIIKKKFEWNDKIRSLLCDIVKLKLESYGMSKLRAQSAEEYLKSFLKLEVKPLWPKGWMHVRILFKESKSVYNKMTLYKAKKVPPVNKAPPLSISVGNVPNTNTKDTSPHSNNNNNNNNMANVHLDSPTGYPNATTDVSPILNALATAEMKEHSPTSEKLSENIKSVWNLLEYTDCQPQQSSLGENLPMNSTPIGLLNSASQIPLYFSHASPDGSIKEEKHNNPSESVKESQSSLVANNSSIYHHGISQSSSSNLVPIPLLSTQTSNSPQISPSVKVSYSHISPAVTPTSTKQQQQPSQGMSSINLGGKTSLHSQVQLSNNKLSMSDPDSQNLPALSVGGVAAALLAKHSPQQQASPSGLHINDPMSPSFNYGHKDSSALASMKADAKHQQNSQNISGTSVSKCPNLPVQVSPTYQNLNKLKDSSPPLQNKLPSASSPQMNLQVMTKTVPTKKDPSLPATNPEKSQNAGNVSPSGQFSPKGDCKNTYLAEFQRYAASCLKTPLTSEKVKVQQPVASTTTITLATTPVSKGLDVNPLLPQQTRSSYQLTTSSPSQHPLGKIDVPSSAQQTQLAGHPTHLQQQQQQQIQQQQQQIQQQQKPMTHGMSQNLHQPHHTPKTHPSSHPSHQQHSKQWRPQQSSQQHNRHQPMQQQQQQQAPKAYSSQHASSLKPMSASISQVVNYQQQQLNVQKAQSHVKVQSQQPRTTISPQQQTKTDNNVLKQHLSTALSPSTTTTIQTVSSLTASVARHTHHPQNSVMNTNANSKLVTGVASSQRATGMHNLQSQPSSLKQQQSRSHCLESALAAASPSTTPSTISASLSAVAASATSSGSVYKLPTITNITSSVGATSHQHPSYSFSQPTSHTVTSLPQQSLMRSQLRAVLPSKNTSSGSNVAYTAMSSSQGMSSAHSWNISGGSGAAGGGGGISQVSSATSTSSCRQTSSPVFSSSYLQQQQQQHGSATTSQNYSPRNLPGLALDKIQPSLTSASHLNQGSARHSKSE